VGVARVASLALAPAAIPAQFVRGFSSTPPFLFGPGEWHKAAWPHYKQFLDQLTEVMEQCATAWDTQIAADSRRDPDVGMLTSISDRMADSVREIAETHLSDAEFLFLDEP
jgi:hypothetical protein